ncbi:MAG: cereblon family protein [Pseudomonadales bacterium]|nr:cereblon family protein [Pseudomonadales bacterium]
MTGSALELRETPKPEWLRQTRDETSTPDDDAGAGVRCAACGGLLTEPDRACERAGAHHHRLTNPAGLTFEVLLFGAAEGCERRGPAIREHSWFPPSRWTLAHCRSCGVQVGWFFDTAGEDSGPGSEAPFVGLMADRVRIEAPGASH